MLVIDWCSVIVVYWLVFVVRVVVVFNVCCSLCPVCCLLWVVARRILVLVCVCWVLFNVCCSLVVARVFSESSLRVVCCLLRVACCCCVLMVFDCCSVFVVCCRVLFVGLLVLGRWVLFVGGLLLLFGWCLLSLFPTCVVHVVFSGRCLFRCWPTEPNN